MQQPTAFEPTVNVKCAKELHVGFFGSDTTDISAFLVPRMSAWRRNAIKRPLTRMPDEATASSFRGSCRPERTPRP
jgi:hypothetical protein